jgi:hypothetical protein
MYKKYGKSIYSPTIRDPGGNDKYTPGYLNKDPINIRKGDTKDRTKP